MNTRFACFLVVGAAAIVGTAQADDERKPTQPAHYTQIEGVFFPGAGFSSQPESYAAYDTQAMTVGTTESSAPARSPEGHKYSLSEYLFFSGTGFASNAN